MTDVGKPIWNIIKDQMSLLVYYWYIREGVKGFYKFIRPEMQFFNYIFRMGAGLGSYIWDLTFGRFIFHKALDNLTCWLSLNKRPAVAVFL